MVRRLEHRGAPSYPDQILPVEPVTPPECPFNQPTVARSSLFFTLSNPRSPDPNEGSFISSDSVERAGISEDSKATSAVIDVTRTPESAKLHPAHGIPSDYEVQLAGLSTVKEANALLQARVEADRIVVMNGKRIDSIERAEFAVFNEEVSKATSAVARTQEARTQESTKLHPAHGITSNYEEQLAGLSAMKETNALLQARVETDRIVVMNGKRIEIGLAAVEGRVSDTEPYHQITFMSPSSSSVETALQRTNLALQTQRKDDEAKIRTLGSEYFSGRGTPPSSEATPSERGTPTSSEATPQPTSSSVTEGRAASSRAAAVSSEAGAAEIERTERLACETGEGSDGGGGRGRGSSSRGAGVRRIQTMNGRGSAESDGREHGEGMSGGRGGVGSSASLGERVRQLEGELEAARIQQRQLRNEKESLRNRLDARRKEVGMLKEEISKEISHTCAQEHSLRERVAGLEALNASVLQREQQVAVREAEAQATMLQAQVALRTYTGWKEMDERERVVAAREMEVERLGALAAAAQQQAAVAAKHVAQREQWLQEGEAVLVECAQHLRASGDYGTGAGPARASADSRSKRALAQRALQRLRCRTTSLAWGKWRHQVCGICAHVGGGPPRMPASFTGVRVGVGLAPKAGGLMIREGWASA